jgi:hypothetical protein
MLSKGDGEGSNQWAQGKVRVRARLNLKSHVTRC